MKRPATKWGRVALLILTGAVAAFQLGKVPVALPALRRELGIDSLTASWILAIFSVIGALAGSVFGAFGDRLGHRRVVVGGLALLAAASAGGAFARATAPLLVARVAEGFCFVAVVVSVPPLILAATAPHDRRFALGLWSLYVPLGSALVLFAAPIALAHGGWSTLWLATALGAAAFALLVATRVAPAPARVDDPKASAVRELRAVLAARYPLVLAAGFAGYAAMYTALVGFLPTLLIGAGENVARAASATAAVVVANGVGNVLGGVVAGSRPRWLVILWGVALMGAGAVVLNAHEVPLALRYDAGLLGALAGGMVPAAVMASVPLHAPNARLVGTTQGLVVQGSSIGQLCGPVLVAAVGGTAGGASAAATMACFAAIAIAAAIVLRLPESHSAAAQA